MEKHKAVEELTKIKTLLKTERISYTQAKELADPFLRDINKQGKEIAKKHKRNYSPVGFSYFMR